MSLLSDAKSVPIKATGVAFTPSAEQVELAIAWAQGSVTTVQAQTALINSGVKKNSTSGHLYGSLKYAVKTGVLVAA